MNLSMAGNTIPTRSDAAAPPTANRKSEGRSALQPGFHPSGRTVSNRGCPRCHSAMVYSRAHSVREDLALALGGDLVRCARCARRFVCFLRFSIPTSNYDGYSNTGDSFKVVWFAIFGGLLCCLGIAFVTLHKFHRWPF